MLVTVKKLVNNLTRGLLVTSYQSLYYFMTNYAGNVYNRLTVLISFFDKKRQLTIFNCKCVCGTEKNIVASQVKSGRVKSCGCYGLELRAKNLTTHGKSYSKEYQVWHSMISRCKYEKSDMYKKYGGRGIRVCDRWANSFELFLLDMGSRPTNKHSIDRIDVNGNYEPSNCRWATIDVQANNRRNNVHIEYMGITLTRSQWARRLNCNPSTFYLKCKSHTPKAAIDYYANKNSVLV